MFQPQVLTWHPSSLQRLGNLYLACFWALTACFYISLVKAGAQPTLALLACTCAALGLQLLRVGAETPMAKAQALDSAASVPALAAVAMLLIEIEALLQRAQQVAADVGLMLVRVRVPETDNTVRSNALGALRQHLSARVDSDVFQIDDRTLAVVECDCDAAYRLEMLSAELHAVVTASSDAPRLIVAGAITDNPGFSAADLLATARWAVKLADAENKDTLFREI